ncbi:MAG: hypothetical protein N3E41_08630 [Thermofilaceae archaeon]|nr:hypothetical protein [Thermofilaceae archaeon]
MLLERIVTASTTVGSQRTFNSFPVAVTVFDIGSRRVEIAFNSFPVAVGLVEGSLVERESLSILSQLLWRGGEVGFMPVKTLSILSQLLSFCCRGKEFQNFT